MKKQWPQDECPAAPHSARDLTEAVAELPSGGCGEATLTVRSGNHSKRPVLRAAFVDVDPRSDELREQLVWWLNEVLALLHGPNAQIWVWDPFAHGDAEVLVQRDQPILLGRLIEERALDCDA